MLRSRNLMTLGFICTALLATPTFYSCNSTETASEQMSDSAITTKIKSKYVADSEVAASGVSVETNEGTVYLTGRVKSQHEKDKAEEIARQTHGVKSVVNNIKVGDKTPH